MTTQPDTTQDFGVRSAGTLLVVDDVPANIHMISSILRNDHTVFFATNGEDALRLAKERQPDLILLDVMMPDIDGYAVCQILRETPQTRDIPVIFVSGLADEEDEERGLALGAVDYFVKPLRPSIVRMRVRNHLELKRQRDLLKELNPSDELTGLSNKKRFEQALDNEWRRCRRVGATVSVFLCRIDHFSAFNEALGFAKGDDCLRKVARTIAGYLCRPGDLAARYSGVAFVALLPETDLDGAMKLAEEARSAVEALAIEHPASPVGDVITVSCGVGACVPDTAVLPKQLMEFVGQKVAEAQAEGCNTVRGDEC